MLSKKTRDRIQNNRERRLARFRHSRLNRALDEAPKPTAFTMFADEHNQWWRKTPPVSGRIERATQKRLTDVMAERVDKLFTEPKAPHAQ